MHSKGISRIALVGKIRSGKTSVAEHLEYKHNFIRLSFGDALKRVANELFEGSSEYKFEPIYRDCPFSDDGQERVGYRKPRRLYQDVGTALRELDPDVWIRQVERSMRVWENMRNVHGIIIDDLRQLNEEKWARENGFTIVRISANEDTRIERAKRAGDDFNVDDLRHDTEQYIDDFIADYEIDNDGDLDEMKRKIDAIMSEMTYDGNGDVFYNVK